MFGRDKRMDDGLRFYCKSCNNASYKDWYSSDPEKAKQVSKDWRIRNPDKRQEIWLNYKARDKHKKLVSKYNITLEQYLDMHEMQGGTCAICELPEIVQGRDLAVDHDHSTGKVRGLLCSKCNRGIGMFNDDAKTIKKAMMYVQKELG
jgi:hypothetical protein